MNTWNDKITTIIGAVLGILVAFGGVTSDQATQLTQALSVVAGILIVIFGHQTNKVKQVVKQIVVYPPDEGVDKPKALASASNSGDDDVYIMEQITSKHWEIKKKK